jgi:uncharacterized metal-binding protein YceD (DUF177 family)
MTGTEFSRPVRLDTLGDGARMVTIEADERERAALAARFDLLALARLEATAAITREGDVVTARGRLTATATQRCIATDEPVPARVDEAFALRFVPDIAAATEELELAEQDLDTLPYDGGAIDLGEAVAQEFALALDPFPRSPDADAHLRAAGVLREEEAEAQRRSDGPFGILKDFGR